MGDPKRISRKYTTPSHPWQKERIDEERILLREYGMKNKKEIWKMVSQLKSYKQQVKNLVPRRDVQAEKEERLLMDKLRKYGLLDQSSTLEDVLDLHIRDVCERRLQTLVRKKKLARSVTQARQLITHDHISVAGRKITSPSYIVSVEEENAIVFAENSPFKDENHPERFPMGGDELAESPIIKKKRKKEEEKAKVKDNKALDKKPKKSGDKESEKKKEAPKKAEEPVEDRVKEEKKEEVKEDKPKKDEKIEEKSKEKPKGSEEAVKEVVKEEVKVEGGKNIEPKDTKEKKEAVEEKKPEEKTEEKSKEK